jgi:intracellular sulfur oxidation DsrE/DsrF family protein
MQTRTMQQTVLQDILMKNKFILIVAFIFSSFFFSQATLASSPGEQVEHILTLNEAPVGIVFEVVTGASNSLKWALPQIQDYIKEIHARFPTLDIAIVTHGEEMFALKTTNNKKYKKVHSLTQQLVKNENIQLHVCGTYAGMRNITTEAFPDYVDVTAAGPATINDYVSLGYILIEL